MTNTSEKYAALDKAVMSVMSDKPKMFTQIFCRVIDECEKIAKATKVEPFRFLDRRLQALRKAGKIRSTTKGWVLVPSK